MRIDGKQIANKILEDLKIRVKKLQEENITPCLAIILVGNDPASVAYVKRKEIKAREIGIEVDVQRLPENISQEKLLNIVKQYGIDKNIHGIIVQQPLPSQIDIEGVINSIGPEKDVDGVCPNSKFEMPIVMAVLKILKEIFSRCNLDQGATLTEWLQTKQIIVIGKGKTGGAPIIAALKKLESDPLIIDSKITNPKLLTKNADIIISAVGKPNVLRPDMLRKGVILIGVGISRGDSAKLIGDYDQNAVEYIASFYTPTPGGVGPVNVAYLLKNLVYAAL